MTPLAGTLARAVGDSPEPNHGDLHSDALDTRSFDDHGACRPAGVRRRPGRDRAGRAIHSGFSVGWGRRVRPPWIGKSTNFGGRIGICRAGSRHSTLCDVPRSAARHDAAATSVSQRPLRQDSPTVVLCLFRSVFLSGEMVPLDKEGRGWSRQTQRIEPGFRLSVARNNNGHVGSGDKEGVPARPLEATRRQSRCEPRHKLRRPLHMDGPAVSHGR